METSGKITLTTGLSKLLADTYALALKTQNFHWNVTGSMFLQLHELFDRQYKELAEALDDVAERLRAIGEYAPGSFSEYMKQTSITDAKGHPGARLMIEELRRGHETIIQTAKDTARSAIAFNDEATLELLSRRILVHEKATWMLKAVLAD